MSTAKVFTSQTLPDDAEELKALVIQLASRVAALEEYVLLGRAKQFGVSTEKSPDQQEMFNEAELSVVAEEALREQEAEREAHSTTSPKNTDKPKKKPGRKPLPAELPRIRVEHLGSEHEIQCDCGCQRTAIGEETSEQLDIIPAKMQVIVNVRKKYVCRQCESIKTVPLPPQPIPKSNASPGLLAHIAISKYQDSVPLHRQEAGLSRSGVDIPRNTLASWMIRSGELIQPIINLFEDKLLAYPVMHCDETTVQVLNEPDKHAHQTSYMWVRAGGPTAQPIRLFHYADSRKGEVANQLFADYQGYLQTDDYAGYNAAVNQGNITQLGCWAHARRKFIDAQKVIASKTKKAGKADIAINLISKLYAIEKRIRELSAEEKQTIRQQEAIPILDKLRQWLDKTLHTTLPKGLLGKALSYLDKNWAKLTLYTEDGRLSIDNNPAENAIRPFVIGRKNWLFSASVRGAKSSANLYSLIETAKINGQEPYAYLHHVFKELPKAISVEEIEALLPWNVNKHTIAIG